MEGLTFISQLWAELFDDILSLSNIAWTRSEKKKILEFLAQMKGLCIILKDRMI